MLWKRLFPFFEGFITHRINDVRKFNEFIMLEMEKWFWEVQNFTAITLLLLLLCKGECLFGLGDGYTFGLLTEDKFRKYVILRAIQFPLKSNVCPFGPKIR
jgi:hypothetical protein